MLLNLPILAPYITAVFIILIAVWQSWEKDKEIKKIKVTRPNIIADPNFPDHKELFVITTGDIYPENNSDAKITYYKQMMMGTSGYLDISPMIQGTNLRGEIREGDNVERYSLVIRNVKSDGINLVDSDPIHAKITFYDFADNEILSHEKPRWRGTKPPNQHKENIKVSASGKPLFLCLVMRKIGEPPAKGLMSPLSSPRKIHQ